MKINKQKGGIIRWLITIIALIALASFFFNFSVQEVVEDEQTQQNFGYIWTNVSYVYDTYLSGAVDFIWNDIIRDTIWHNFTENRELIESGEASIFEQSIPHIEIPE